MLQLQTVANAGFLRDFYALYRLKDAPDTNFRLLISIHLDEILRMNLMKLVT